MKRTWIVALVSAVAILAVGCDKHEGDHKHGEKTHGATGGAVTVPDHYKDAVLKCEELSSKIGGLIDAGKLGDVHGPAEDIKKIAEKLPEMAQKEMKAEMLKEINIKAKELAGMFHEIDEVADAGKKEETIKLHKKMKELIAGLKAHIH